MVNFKKKLQERMATKNSAASLRSQLKATPIKSLKKQVDEDNEMIGAYAANEYLNLEDGKTIKIRIFPAHPGVENFYLPKKCYWLSIAGNDGDMRRAQVLDSCAHGGTKYDLVDEYVKWAKKKWAKDSDRLDALTGTGPNSNSLNPQYSWLCYADRVTADDPLKAKVWEFKKMVRDALNKLAFSEDEDEAIEIDPFTDPDEGLPILVKYMKNPNKKKGETYYEVSFPKKVTARPLTDEEIEYFMGLKPLNELLPKYGIRDFERALEGLQNFDEENEMGLFDDDDWLEHVEEIKAQYDGEEDDEDDKPAKKKTSKKVTKKSVEDEDDDETEEEEEKPKSKSKPSKKKPEPEDEEEEETEEEPEEEEADDNEEDDGLDDLDRAGLKKYIRENELEISIKKSMSDDDIREAIREALADDDNEEETEEEPEEEDDDEDEKPKAKVSLADIKKKLAGKK
nr:MAG TPA: hypothetical protein [Caudoviricetes sp.]